MVHKEKDPWLHMKQIAHYVRTNELHDSVAKGERKNIKAAATASFIAEGRHVYYCGYRKADSGPVKRRLVIEDKEEMKRILEEVHDKDGHGGTRSTQFKVTEKYYWPTITSDIQDWVKKCPKCQFFQKLKTQAPDLHPIKPEGRWDILGMDLIGPFPITPRENRFVITMTDLYTKWVVAYPLKDKSAPSVAEAIMKMIHTFGPPLKIITDQGKEFVNELNKNVFSLFDIKHLVASAYHPQTNGQAERTNRSLKTALEKYCNETMDDWDMFISSAVYGINTSRQATTKYSPFFLMFFRDVRRQRILNAIHEDCKISIECESGRDDDDISAEIESSMEICKTVKANIERTQKKMKADFAARKKGVKKFSINVGDKVKKKNSRKEGRKGDRLQMEWLGPYTVTAVSEKGVCVIKSLDEKKTQQVNIKNLSLFWEREEAESPPAPAPAPPPPPPPSLVPPVAPGLTPPPSLSLYTPPIAPVPTPVLPHISASAPAPVPSHPLLPVSQQTPTPLSHTLTATQHSPQPPSLTLTPSPPPSSTAAVRPCKRARTVVNLGVISSLSRGAWLTDEPINYAQSLLKKQYPDIHGLQDTVVFQTIDCGGVIRTPKGKFVQILHINGNHWICATSLGCGTGQVKIYDSMTPSSPQPSLLKIIAVMLNHKGPAMELVWESFQKQQGSSDCGLFAVAAAVSLCGGQDPALCQWDQGKMRDHLIESFKQEYLAPFPSQHRRKKGMFSRKIQRYSLFCSCRQPYLQGASGDMAQCKNCSEWYHEGCENIPRQVFNKKILTLPVALVMAYRKP